MFDDIRNYCLSLPAVSEHFPFDDRTMVWKVAGKMFCLGDIMEFDSINLKCNPEKAIELREQFEQIKPGYHMNKTMWNTVSFNGLDKNFIFDLILHSYEEVVRKLPKKLQTEINSQR